MDWPSSDIAQPDITVINITLLVKRLLAYLNLDAQPFSNEDAVALLTL
jgi:hypothetical protein